MDLRKYWMVVHRMDPGFKDVLDRKGIDEAAVLYRDVRQQDSTALLFTEAQMNRLGYVYLSRNRVSEALSAFRLNIEAFPESFNVYDSYAEALMADHQYEKALKHYARSVALNPSNNNGKEKLAEVQRLLSAPVLR